MSVNKVLSTGELEPIAGGTFYSDTAVGSIIPFGGSVIPSSFLLCNGQSILRTDYPELFAVIGTSFGSVDSTHFNVPDLRGKTLVGYNSSETEFNAIGKTGGEKTHKLTTAEMPSHTHEPKNSSGQTMTFIGDDNGSNPIPVYSSTSSYAKTDFTYLANTGGNGAHNNLQPYNTVNYIIKATSIALPSDFINEIEEMFSYKDFNGMKYRIIGKSFDAFGYIADTETASGFTLQLPVTMQDTNYAVIVTNNTTSASAIQASTYTVAKTTTSMKVGMYGSHGPIAYQIKGIIA